MKEIRHIDGAWFHVKDVCVRFGLKCKPTLIANRTPPSERRHPDPLAGAGDTYISAAGILAAVLLDESDAAATLRQGLLVGGLAALDALLRGEQVKVVQPARTALPLDCPEAPDCSTGHLPDFMSVAPHAKAAVDGAHWLNRLVRCSVEYERGLQKAVQRVFRAGLLLSGINAEVARLLDACERLYRGKHFSERSLRLARESYSKGEAMVKEKVQLAEAIMVLDSILLVAGMRLSLKRAENINLLLGAILTAPGFESNGDVLRLQCWSASPHADPESLSMDRLCAVREPLQQPSPDAQTTTSP